MSAGAARRVAVIGAGYAGLAAAMTLVREGCIVTLFESNRVPGGRARRVEYRGTTLDNGQHILLGAYRETLALMNEAGVPANALRRMPLTLHFPRRMPLVAPRLPAPYRSRLTSRQASIAPRRRSAGASKPHAPANDAGLWKVPNSMSHSGKSEKLRAWMPRSWCMQCASGRCAK